ncbi:MAG: DUF2000 domain-containing protein [bacterium]|nr:DUF2000 domain-containing protein [bacterium]
MGQNVSVLIVNEQIPEVGILVNAGFVLGLTVGRLLPQDTFGPDVTDGDGEKHTFLTRIGHYVRKASPNKLVALRQKFATTQGVVLVDYTEDAAPADYEAYTTSLGAHRGPEISYRAIYVYGPEEIIVPLTKNLSRL